MGADARARHTTHRARLSSRRDRRQRTPPHVRHLPRLLDPGGMGAHELHPTRDTSPASFIPEGWEPIAPGRAKHAPGDNAHDYEHAPRQGCEGSRSFNPSRVVHPFPRVTRGRFAPRATRSHASGVKTSQRDGNPRTRPTRAPSLASYIPEGWEPIAPGRAKHAPGDNAFNPDSADRIRRRLSRENPRVHPGTNGSDDVPPDSRYSARRNPTPEDSP